MYLLRCLALCDISWNRDDLCRRILGLNLLLQGLDLLRCGLIAVVVQDEARRAIFRAFYRAGPSDAAGRPCDADDFVREE